MKRDYYVMIERDEDGFYVGEVPSLCACYAQGRTLEELMANVREVIQLCLESGAGERMPTNEFIGVQKVSVE